MMGLGRFELCFDNLKLYIIFYFLDYLNASRYIFRVPNFSLDWHIGLKYIVRRNSQSLMDYLFRTSWKACIYFIWCERNNKIFKEQQATISALIIQIISAVRARTQNNNMHVRNTAVNRATTFRWKIKKKLI